MPFISSNRPGERGITPDIIMNPHAVPSRMTIGLLMEIVASKHAALAGERVNASAFNNFDIDVFRRNLHQYGYNQWSNVTMTNGMTGKQFTSQIFVGPCYYQALKHHVVDKVQVRGLGAVKRDTHQPVEGRKRGGGQRFGEMERDAIISHGVSAVLQERLCLSSDAINMVFCANCGVDAITDHTMKNYICRTCGDRAEFGTCRIPGAFKQLMHILTGAGMKLKLKFENK